MSWPGRTRSRLGFATAQRGHPGARAVNEDSAGHAVEDEAGCWAVADGLGGHGHGDIASRAAVHSIIELLRHGPLTSREGVSKGIEVAQRAVRDAQREAEFSHMRTTLALLVSDGRLATWGHVGDTRVYHFRGGLVRGQTRDHSVPQMLVEAGEITPDQIRLHPDRSRILRALGEDGEPRPDVSQPVQLEEGDAFLLCTDGWWEYVTEREMEIDLAKSLSPDEWLDKMTERILSRARGEFDNFTAVGVLVFSAGAGSRPLS